LDHHAAQERDVAGLVCDRRST